MFSLISPTPAFAEKQNNNKNKGHLGASAAHFVAAG